MRARGATDEAIAQQLQSVELNGLEAAKAVRRLEGLGIPQPTRLVHNGDFFTFYRSHLADEVLLGTLLSAGRRFDAVIGNPPFIRYQNFPETFRTLAFDLMRRAGLTPNRLTNTWVPFLVAATLSLNERGRLAMVIPAELLQVHYAAEVRQFLSDCYDQITLVTFRELVFDDIQQEVVLVLGERQADVKGQMRVLELNGVTDLPSCEALHDVANERKSLEHSTEKWTLYFLDAAEIGLLRALRHHPDLALTNQVLDVNVGLVTGQNDFFLLTEEQVSKRGLAAQVSPVVSRSAHLEGAHFGVQDWQENVARGLPAYLFYPSNDPLAQQPAPVQGYVSEGEAAGFHRGYKCRIRENWYHVPSFWVPDAFMLRQVHGYPKLVLNESRATCTDTIHRVRFMPATCGKLVVAAFLNSLTFAAAEVTGRSYGGGVLTFEPSEGRSLPLPLKGAEALDLEQIDSLVRANRIEAVLDVTDAALLQAGLGLSRSDARRLRGMWAKLRDRRIRRKHRRSA